MTADKINEAIEYAIAPAMHGGAFQPDMSGDPRAKLNPAARRRCEDADVSVVEMLKQEGYAIVPTEPTEAQWSGLARHIMSWFDMTDKSAPALLKHLSRLGIQPPQWLLDEKEMRREGVPSKGTRITIIYRAMIAAAQEDGQ